MANCDAARMNDDVERQSVHREEDGRALFGSRQGGLVYCILRSNSGKYQAKHMCMMFQESIFAGHVETTPRKGRRKSRGNRMREVKASVCG